MEIEIEIPSQKPPEERKGDEALDEEEQEQRSEISDVTSTSAPDLGTPPIVLQ